MELMKKDTGTNSDLCISQGGKGKKETELGAKCREWDSLHF